ncbi:MAG: hypothetical protein LAO30_26060 [Acidobacteriia bacterium]|nr:hypothetical protein [Terriglobia bacterium]
MDIRAALDWQAILSTGANLLTIASVLWAAYERFVKPKLDRSDGTTRPFLFISLRRPDGTFVQFSLGNEYKNKEIFVEQFTRQVTELRAVSVAGEGPFLLSELIQNEDWVRVHVRDGKDS